MARQSDTAVIIGRLKSLANPENAAGMARFGIAAENTLGIPMPVLRKLGKEIGKDHLLALELWASKIHEARILASLVDDPGFVTETQIDKWAGEFDSWDVCDQCCMNLFSKTPLAYTKAKEWSERKEMFVKRAAFALIACLAWNDKKASDDALLQFLPIIKREAGDDRNFVKKSVNWALRQIGKRNRNLNTEAISAAREIADVPSRSAGWIASDALRELAGDAVQARLRNKG